MYSSLHKKREDVANGAVMCCEIETCEDVTEDEWEGGEPSAKKARPSRSEDTEDELERTTAEDAAQADAERRALDAQTLMNLAVEARDAAVKTQNVLRNAARAFEEVSQRLGDIIAAAPSPEPSP